MKVFSKDVFTCIVMCREASWLFAALQKEIFVLCRDFVKYLNIVILMGCRHFITTLLKQAQK